MRARLLLLALVWSGLVNAPALAHDREPVPPAPTYPGHWGGPFGLWYGGWQPQVVVQGPAAPPAPVSWQGANEGRTLDRDSWLRECRRRLGDNGTGGAVIGGVIGGLAGNLVAGRGNRVLGTVAGGAVGAVAGAAIDKAEDRQRVRDRCEAMLAGPETAQPGSAPAGISYGYAVPVMWVPVMMAPAAAPPRTETVVTEEIRDEPVSIRRRMPARRNRGDKRVAN